MSATARRSVRLFLEIDKDRTFVLKITHYIRPRGHEYLRSFIECHSAQAPLLAAARHVASKHGGEAQVVNQTSGAVPLLTASLPLPPRASPQAIAAIVSELVKALDLAS